MGEKHQLWQIAITLWLFHFQIFRLLPLPLFKRKQNVQISEEIEVIFIKTGNVSQGEHWNSQPQTWHMHLMSWYQCGFLLMCICYYQQNRSSKLCGMLNICYINKKVACPEDLTPKSLPFPCWPVSSSSGVSWQFSGFMGWLPLQSLVAWYGLG